MWKIIGWILAGIGTVVVVRKAAPWIVRHLAAGERALPYGREPRQLPQGSTRSGVGPQLVDCGLGGTPAPGGGTPTPGYQSATTFRWCYVVRAGDTAGSIAEAITGDSARYVEILVANPSVPKQGKMGVVIGPDAWDFASGALAEGTKILVSQTMNAWIDQRGVAQGGYLPYPPDPRTIEEIPVAAASSTAGDDFPPPPDMSDDDEQPIGASPTWSDGFDYVGGV